MNQQEFDHPVVADDNSDRCDEGRRRFLGGVSSVATLCALSTTGMAGQSDGGQDPLPSAREASPGGSIHGVDRAESAYRLRTKVALTQRLQPIMEHPTNGDEDRYPNRIGNFSKGLPHNQMGEVDPVAYRALLTAIRTGDPIDFDLIPMGGDALLKNPQAGLTYELAGGDPACFYQAPPPAFSSAEIAAEIAENYWMALARDVNFQDYDVHPIAIAAAADLSRFTNFRGPRPLVSTVRAGGAGPNGAMLGESPVVVSGGDESIWQNGQVGPAPARMRQQVPVTPNVLFRGLTPGDLTGPLISQFLWMDIPYGAQTISQRMRTPIPGDDYLTNYDDWLFAQNSRGNANMPNRYDVTRRYIRNGRDLGEWVHIDVLFQAGFSAVLQLLGMGAPVDRNNPYVNSRTQCGFGTFGAPHIQSIVCGVAASALRAVWYQKWFVHRRLRPEAFGGRIHNHLSRKTSYPLSREILESAAPHEVFRQFGSYLLPIAFAEGSPSHPAYGAGHATVAGACVTILKAWFDESWVIPNPVVPTPEGLSLVPYRGPSLTVGGELNKLASNIALGRNMAGVHWRSDATESLRLGEAVAIAFLTDLKNCYNEDFPGFSLTKFDGQRLIV